MDIARIRALLDDPVAAGPWFLSCGVNDVTRGHANLVRMATAGVTLDLLADLCDQLVEHLPKLSDADMALNNLDRFVASARNPLSLATLFERDREALPTLLQIFSTSQHLSDLMVADSGSYDLLRLTEGQPVQREELIRDVCGEVAALNDDALVLAALRRFKQRETLRIAYGDIIRGQRLETVTSQISYLADALLEAAVRRARAKLEAKRGIPLTPAGAPARFCVLAMGKLGGSELNYSSDIDLIFLYDHDGKTSLGRHTNAEFFDALARDIVKLLTETTDMGYVYRVDLRLRPEGERGPMVSSLESAFRYYDVLGRTWERQAYVKARPAAGDIELGRRFLAQLEPWIYRRYLGLADIAGIKALKRRIEQRTIREGAHIRDVKTGHGGLRDIEFAIQFLQLLNGGDLAEVRTGNTLDAIIRLESVGCLTHQERGILEESYRFLRKLEHRLQIMLDLQTHLLPEQPSELRKVAIRMGYADQGERSALAAFEADYKAKTDLNRGILDHLLHDAFGDDPDMEPEVDLVLDPDPPGSRVHDVLSRYGFRDVDQAYRNLVSLSTERVRFLSTRRCRHFLAANAPRLLKAVAATPDPDATLVTLDKVSDSLGGKGVLWELFRFNEPSLRLYIQLCASSPYLSGLLISNPGMIDELMDSLVLNKLPRAEMLRAMLADLCRGAEDLEPILHSFKNAQQLNVGVRDILGKEDVQATTGALSDIAEVCLEQIVAAEYEKLVSKLGEPTLGEGDRAGEPCELVILAMGKFGGRELNYHSDLDIVFLYEGDGPTAPRKRLRRGEATTNQHFFSELGQRVIKFAGQLGPLGRLYEVDPRLRPTGRSGALAYPFVEFSRYFSSGEGQLWERQALCRARPVHGSPRAMQAAQRLVEEAAYELPWTVDVAAGIVDMRMRLQETAGKGNLKRGLGGIVDIEFLAQWLQLRHGPSDPKVRHANTLQALRLLHEGGYLTRPDFDFLSASYRFLRTLEGRLRLTNTAARDDLPTDPIELTKLARLLGYADGAGLLADCERYTAGNRARFLTATTT